MRVRTAKESSPSKIELANNTSYVRANFNKNTTSSLKSNARTMTTHEKYLSPWKM